MQPYAATPKQMSVKRFHGERSKNRRLKAPVRAEKKAARRLGRLMIEREIVSSKAEQAALAAEERLWQEEQMREDEQMFDLIRDEEQQYWDEWDPYDDYLDRRDEPELFVPPPYEAYDDFYYQFVKDEDL